MSGNKVIKLNFRVLHVTVPHGKNGCSKTFNVACVQ